MRKYDVVIVGGGPAGLAAAYSARTTYPEKSVCIIRMNKAGINPSGIPYAFHSIRNVYDNIVPDINLRKKNIDIIIDQVVDIDRKRLKLSDFEDISYKKLVLATGSMPFIPPIDGNDLDGVMYLHKDIEYIRNMVKQVQNANKIAILGGEYLGIEIADELLHSGKEILIIESDQSLFPQSMDVEFGEMALDIVNELCGEAILGHSVKKIEGKDKVEKIVLENGDSFDVDAVIINAGLKPNTALAKKVGLLVDENGINVDENMRTSGKDIYAIGDCAATRCFFSGDYTSAMHTSTSLAQARLAGANLFEMKMRKGFNGSLMAFSSKLGNGAFGTTGLTEKRASELDIEYYIGKNLIMDRNAVRLKGMERVFLKMLYQKNTNVLIGAQIKGGQAVAELVNFFTTIIQQRMTREEIDSLQIDTHPLLSSAPINFPAITATANAMLDWFKKAA